MVEGKALIEATSPDGVLMILGAIKTEFYYMSATEPVLTADGRYVSAVTFSNDTTIMEVKPKCG